MKKTITLCLAAILLLSLWGCGGGEPAMKLSPAELTGEEEALAKLLGVDSEQILFDFTVDGTMQSIQVNSYRLEDGQWVLKAGGGGWNQTAREGRIALGMERIPDGLRVAIQCGDEYSITKYSAPEEQRPQGCATSRLTEAVDIVYEQEIPLVVQILTDKDQVITYGAEGFYHPEDYVSQGYEAVYAVTVRFSQKSVS